MWKVLREIRTFEFRGGPSQLEVDVAVQDPGDIEVIRRGSDREHCPLMAYRSPRVKDDFYIIRPRFKKPHQDIYAVVFHEPHQSSLISEFRLHGQAIEEAIRLLSVLDPFRKSQAPVETIIYRVNTRTSVANYFLANGELRRMGEEDELALGLVKPKSAEQTS